MKYIAMNISTAVFFAVFIISFCLSNHLYGKNGKRSFAGKIDQQSSQRKDVAQKIEMTDRNIIILKSQQERLKRELSENHKNKGITEREINNLNRDLAMAGVTIEQLRIMLKSAAQRHLKYLDDFCTRLIHYHRVKSKPWLSVLFNSRDITDLIRRLRYYSLLSKKDTDTLVKLQVSKESLKKKKAELEWKEQQQSQIKRRLERKNTNLLKLIEDQDRLMVRVRKEKLQANKRIKKLRLAHSYLSKKISSLQRAQTLLEQSNETPKNRGNELKVEKNSMSWPVDGNVEIVRPFGYSENIVGTNEFSAGIDIKISEYKVIKAAAPGTVVYRGPFSETYGNIVMLDHGGSPNNIFTIYGNLDQIFVPRKKIIKAGTAIGSVGEEASLRGRETKFHFEIRKKTTPVDPLQWLKIRKDI